jgi:hypothetical protein
MSPKERILLLLFLGTILSLIAIAYLSDLQVDQLFKRHLSR